MSQYIWTTLFGPLVKLLTIQLLPFESQQKVKYVIKQLELK